MTDNSSAVGTVDVEIDDDLRDAGVTAVEFHERLNDLFRDLEESGPMSSYCRGRKYARVMTAAHAAAAAGDAANGSAYLTAADGLLGPLGEAGAGDLRDFIAGVFREDETRAEFLLDNQDGSEPSIAAFGPQGAATAQAFRLLGRIVALMTHPARRTQPAAVTGLIVDQVKEVANLMSALPTNYQLAMLKAVATEWPELDEPSE